MTDGNWTNMGNILCKSTKSLWYTHETNKDIVCQLYCNLTKYSLSLDRMEIIYWKDSINAYF